MGKRIRPDPVELRLAGVSWLGLKTMLKDLVAAIHADDRAEISRKLEAWDLGPDVLAATVADTSDEDACYAPDHNQRPDGLPRAERARPDPA